jgi:hypothetical protein
MIKQLRHNRYTFIEPDGFKLDPDSSNLTPDESEPIQGILPSLSLSFVTSDQSKAADPDRSATELDLSAFAPTLSFLTLPARFNPDPLVYLQQGNFELEKSIEDFRAEYCRKAMIGNSIAAYSQGMLQTNFTIYRLILAWVNTHDLLTAEITSLQENVEQSWITLHAFANAVALIDT